jgi:uncharacterized protein (TIGR00730 family)
MSTPSSVGVYCGSAANVDHPFREAAAAFGQILGERRIRVIYGGGRVGLMGLVADAALAAGGEVIGVIPRHLTEMEVAHQTLTELRVVGSMHERKQLMVDLSDAFAVLPGGLGTLDETFEILTWRQLGLHDRPVAVLNTQGYWDPFLAMIRSGVRHGFIQPRHAALFRTVDDVAELLPALAIGNSA